jgi:guanosine-3',5'-bis(diphosphate) 3'-pyrophosphohydrolase
VPAIVPPRAASAATIDPDIVPGALDEPPLISADMHPPVDLAEDLERFNARLATYLKPEDITRVGAAYVFANAAHRGQMRLTGAPYISHPLAVAETLAGWHLDSHALTAALLHDVMEDTAITKDQIAERFGKVAAELVDGVSKLDRIEHQSFEEAQAENFRKMLLAMARDVRVILIKLADRLHNMQTLDAMRPEKRRRIARAKPWKSTHRSPTGSASTRFTVNCRSWPSATPIRCATACCRRPSRARAATGAKWSAASSTPSARRCPPPASMPR